MRAETEKRLEAVNAPVKRRTAALLAGRGEPKEVYGVLSDFFSRKGKSLRPVLCIECCRAVGGRESDALQAAVAIEMFLSIAIAPASGRKVPRISSNMVLLPAPFWPIKVIFAPRRTEKLASFKIDFFPYSNVTPLKRRTTSFDPMLVFLGFYFI